MCSDKMVNQDAVSEVEQAIDREAALAGFDGDMEFFVEVIDIFLEESPKLISKINHAIAGGDASALQRAAHTLKGSVGNFHATPAYDAAVNLERMGRDGNLTEAAVLFTAMKKALEDLTKAFNIIKSGY